MEPPPPPYHSTLDEEIEALTLQAQEVSQYMESRKGKDREDELSDHQIAVSAFLNELSVRTSLLSDQRFANSVALAVEYDANEIAAISRQERQAESDRRLAMNLDADTTGRMLNHPAMNHGVVAHHGPKRAQLSVVDRFHDSNDVEEQNTAGPSMSYVQRQEEAIEEISKLTMKCSVCYDSFQMSKVTVLQCGDIYCKGCLKDLFLRATKDESLFPPKCHRGLIPLERVQAEMSPSELENFHQAEVEFSTTDRTYCSNTECSKFILPANITAGRAQCPHCSSATCAMCKKAFHTDDCVADVDLQATLALASAEGWKRCFSCRALVELGVGCYHITCKCSAEFCYLCGVQWKTCSCEIWDENRLIARAEEVVDRDAIRPLEAPERQLRVEQMREDLRENHECDHPGRFERILCNSKRGLKCEMCGDRHKKYVLRCRRCHLQVCEHCRINRI